MTSHLNICSLLFIFNLVMIVSSQKLVEGLKPLKFGLIRPIQVGQALFFTEIKVVNVVNVSTVHLQYTGI